MVKYVRMMGFCYVVHPTESDKEVLVALFKNKNEDIFYIMKEDRHAPGDRIATANLLGELISIDVIKPHIDRVIQRGSFTQIRKLLRESFTGSVWHFVKR